MTDRSALGWVARTERSSGSRTGLTSVRGPPKRASRARTREAVAIGRVGSSGGADGTRAGGGAGSHVLASWHAV